MAFNKLELGVTYAALLEALNENFNAAVLQSLLGAPDGVATLGSDGFVPLTQLNLGALSNISVLLGVTDTPPTPSAAGDQYFDTGTGKIHTWDGAAWDAGTVPSKAKLYLNAANETWYKWTGSAMVPFVDAVQASSVHAFPFVDDDPGWDENLSSGNHFLQIAVDPEGGDAVAVRVKDSAGNTVFVDTAINISGGVTFLTITSGEPFNGTAYVSSVA